MDGFQVQWGLPLLIRWTPYEVSKEKLFHNNIHRELRYEKQHLPSTESQMVFLSVAASVAQCRACTNILSDVYLYIYIYI